MEGLVYKIDGLAADQDSCLLYETLFHNANGYLGVRSNLEEGGCPSFQTIRGTYINGFYDYVEMKQAERLCGLTEEKQTMLNLPDMQGIRLIIGDEEFSMWEGEVLSSHRLVDMEKGVTEREVMWKSPSGKVMRMKSRRMASFKRPSLFTIDYSVWPINFKGTVMICSGHEAEVKNYADPDDPRVAAESFTHLLLFSMERWESGSISVSRTSKSGLSVCAMTGHVLKAGNEAGNAMKADSSRLHDKNINKAGSGHFSEYCIECEAHEYEEIRLLKYCVLTDSVRTQNVKASAAEIMKSCMADGIEVLYEEQKAYLKEFWERSMLSIDGDEELNQALHFNMYQLLQSAGRDGISNIAAKGLSGEGYEGHYFWDTEMYMQPFFVLTNPDICKKLIEFRYHTLDGARENAGILGHKKGAAYPWRTIMGKECSGYYPSGSAAYHISADVAYSVSAYYLATKDLDFIAEMGGEILFETARLWMDLGNFADGKFHINGVTGPDEYTCLVNNNYFTNCNARHNLLWAVKCHDILKKEGRLENVQQRLALTDKEVEEFKMAAEAMVIPYDEKLGINPQDDSFLQKPLWDFEGTPKEHYPLLLHYHPMALYRRQVCKQADTVLAHFLFDGDVEVMRRSFEYYETITTHDSSLSTCIFSIMASRLDQKEKAYRYFGDSAKLDLFNTHKNTKDGIHTANMGGNYMAIVYGFAGFRLKEEGIFFSPVVPDKWNGYQFRLMVEGSIILVEVSKIGCRFRLIKGAARSITVYDQTYVLDSELAVSTEGTRLKAVIFDLDGVITDSARYHYEAWKMLADELQIPFDSTYNEKLKGVSRMESLELILQNGDRTFSREEKLELADRKNLVYQSLIRQMGPEDILPGIKELLAGLRQNHVLTAVASVSHNALYILKQLDLEPMFDYIADPARVKRSKPYPDIFLDCADALGVRPSECVGIEDANSGIEAIHRAGMKAVGVGNPYEMRMADLIMTTAGITEELIRSMAKAE